MPVRAHLRIAILRASDEADGTSAPPVPGWEMRAVLWRGPELYLLWIAMLVTAPLYSFMLLR